MAVVTEINRTDELTTNGVITEFDFDMLIHDKSEVQVWYEVTGGKYTQLTLETNYGVVFTEYGGTVSTTGYIAPLAAGKLLIIRHLELTQQTNWLNLDNHSEQQHQDDFDRSSMRDIQIQEELDRVVSLAIHSSTTGIILPEPEANYLLGWNAAGTNLTNISPIAFAVLIAEEVLGAATIPEDLANLTDVTTTGVAAGDVLRYDGAGWVDSSPGITDTDLLKVDGSPNANEYARFTVNGLEGRTEAEFKADFNLEVGTDFQAWDAQLDDISALAVTNGNFIVGDGANWVAESGNTVRTSLGLGTTDSPTFIDLTLTGALAVTGALASGAVTVTSAAITMIDMINTSADYHGYINVGAGGSIGIVSQVDHVLLTPAAGSDVYLNQAGSSLLFHTDGSGNIGASGANRPNNVFAKGYYRSGIGSQTAPAFGVDRGASGSSGIYFSGPNSTIVDITVADSVVVAFDAADLTFVADYNLTLQGTGYITLPDAGLRLADNTANKFLVGNGTSYAPTSAANSRTALGLGSMATEAAGDYVEIAGDTMTGALIIDTDLTVGTTLYADNTYGTVGIGTAATAGNLFTISKTITPDNNRNIVFGALVVAPTVADKKFKGLYFETTLNSAQAIAESVTVDSKTTLNNTSAKTTAAFIGQRAELAIITPKAATSTITDMAVFRAVSTLGGKHTIITDYCAFDAGAIALGTNNATDDGGITSAYMFKAAAPSIGAISATAIGTLYGLYLGDMAEAHVTTPWAIYSLGGDSYHKDDMAFGQTDKAERIGSDTATTLDLYATDSVDLHNDTNIIGGNELRWWDVGDSHYVGFEAPALTASQIWVLPDADGAADDILTTDGSGNLSWEAVLGTTYGSCGMYSGNWTTVNPTQNTWYNVSDADFIDGQLSDVTHDGSGELTIANTGRYLCVVSCDIESSVAGKHLEIGFEVNGSGSAQTEGIVCRELPGANAETVMTTTAILDLSADDTIELCVRTIEAGNVTIKVDCVSLNCTRIGAIIGVGGDINANGYPQRATMWHDEATVTNGHALAISVDTAQRYNVRSHQDDSSLNDEFTNSFFLKAGTYNFSVLGATFSDSGQVTWFIDGVEVISDQEWYSVGSTRNVVQTETNITVTGNGYHKLNGKCEGHHASSTDYDLYFVKYWFWVASEDPARA